MDHSLIDRQNQDLLRLLCRLSCSSRQTLENESDAGDSFEELLNASSSSLEKEWLDFINSNGYHLPSKAQPYLEAYETRPDFAYSQSQTLIYIDGPHHLRASRKGTDEIINQRLSNSGYTVIRFTTDQKEWPSIVDQYAWVFGSKSSAT